MNRVILLLSLVGYTGVLILLLFLDIILLYNNRVRVQDILKREMQSEAEQIDKDLNTINNGLYNFYANNTNFQKLTMKRTPTEHYSDAYELKEEMSVYQWSNDCLDGYYIVYESDELFYCMDTSIFEQEDIEYMKDLMLNSINHEGISNKYFLNLGEEREYVLIAYKRQQAAVAGVYRLRTVVNKLLSDLPEQYEYTVDIWFKGNADSTSKEMSAELGLDYMTEQNGNSFVTIKDGRTLYGQKVGKTDIWLICCENQRMLTFFSVWSVVLLVLTVLSFALIKILYQYLKRMFVRPMYELVNTMEQIADHSIDDIPTMDMPFYEMELVNHTLREMITEIKKQKDSYYEEKFSRQEAELKFLQMQLKPHFFLNCLKTLSALCIDVGMTEMNEIILRIAEHLRYFQQVERKIVTLREEIAFTENYVALQNMLSNRKIDCDFTMEGMLEESEVPVLCIQTFVENSIKYAKNAQGESLVIRIIIYEVPVDGISMINITINDTGQGYPEDMFESMNQRYKYEGKSVGINNIKRRCDLLYGERANYCFYNMDGAVSELILPKRQFQGRKETENESIVGG